MYIYILHVKEINKKRITPEEIPGEQLYSCSLHKDVVTYPSYGDKPFTASATPETSHTFTKKYL